MCLNNLYVKAAAQIHFKINYSVCVCVERETERMEHVHREDKMAGPSVIQKLARSSTCGLHIHINTQHLGRRSSQNKPRYISGNTHTDHIHKRSAF